MLWLLLVVVFCVLLTLAGTPPRKGGL